MKRTLLLLGATFLLTSCTSINKLVDQGRYDEAFYLGVDRLQSKRKKKTKHVAALEEAYHALNARDQANIDRLQSSTNVSRHQDKRRLYQSMQNRSDYIAHMHPVISKDGYTADIRYIDYTAEIGATIIAETTHRTQLTRELIDRYTTTATRSHLTNAYEMIAIAHDLRPDTTTASLMDNINSLLLEHDYQHATVILEDAAQSGSKQRARQAYRLFTSVIEKRSGYKRAHVKRNRAFELGVDLISVDLSIPNASPYHLVASDIVQNLDLQGLSDFWTIFTTDRGNAVDYTVTVELSYIHPGKEVERTHTYTTTKEIIDGQIPVLDHNNEALQDSTGKIIYTDRFVEVNADVLELYREKTAEMHGRVIIYTGQRNSLLRSIPITQAYVFSDHAVTYRGNKKALSKKDRKRLKPLCAPFPTDIDMTYDLSHVFLQEIHNVLKQQNFS